MRPGVMSRSAVTVGRAFARDPVGERLELALSEPWADDLRERPRCTADCERELRA